MDDQFKKHEFNFGDINFDELRPDYKERLRNNPEFTKTMSSEDFDQLLDKRCVKVKADCMELENFYPRLAVVIPKGTETDTPSLLTHEIPLPHHLWRENALELMNVAGSAAATSQVAVVAVFIETEMWCINGREETIEYLKQKQAGGSPSIQGQPGSIEGVAVVGLSLDHRINCACYALRRSKDKKIILNKPISVAYSSPVRPVDPVHKFLFAHQEVLESFYKGYFMTIAKHPALEDLRKKIKAQVEKDERDGKFKNSN